MFTLPSSHSSPPSQQNWPNSVQGSLPQYPWEMSFRWNPIISSHITALPDGSWFETCKVLQKLLKLFLKLWILSLEKCTRTKPCTLERTHLDQGYHLDKVILLLEVKPHSLCSYMTVCTPSRAPVRSKVMAGLRVWVAPAHALSIWVIPAAQRMKSQEDRDFCVFIALLLARRSVSILVEWINIPRSSDIYHINSYLSLLWIYVIIFNHQQDFLLNLVGHFHAFLRQHFWIYLLVS